MRNLVRNYIQFPWTNMPNQMRILCHHWISKHNSSNRLHTRGNNGTITKEFIYFNREGFDSINTQIICNRHSALLNVVAWWPRGTHTTVQNSSFVLRLQLGAVEAGWRIGECCNIFKMLFLGWLQLLKYLSSVGGQGYVLKPWLMTLPSNPVAYQKQNYKQLHMCKLLFDLAMQLFVMELRINSCRLPLLQTVSHIESAMCDGGPVRMWSRIKNINYHQVLVDPLHEAAAALCMKANFFLI